MNLTVLIERKIFEMGAKTKPSVGAEKSGVGVGAAEAVPKTTQEYVRRVKTIQRASLLVATVESDGDQRGHAPS